MKMTEHAMIRGKQRGIKTEVVDFIIDRGTKTRTRGGAWEYRLTKKAKAQYIAKLKHQIRLAEAAANKAVIVSPNKSNVVTTYHIR